MRVVRDVDQLIERRSTNPPGERSHPEKLVLNCIDFDDLKAIKCDSSSWINHVV